jgi:hypothetical protein
VLYSGRALGGQDYCDDIEAERAVVYIVGCEEVARRSGQFCLLGRINRLFRRAEELVGPGSDLDENESRIDIDHNQINFAATTGEIAGQGLEALCSEEFLGTLFAPSTERFFVGKEPAAVKKHIGRRFTIYEYHLLTVWSL